MSEKLLPSSFSTTKDTPYKTKWLHSCGKSTKHSYRQGGQAIVNEQRKFQKKQAY